MHSQVASFSLGLIYSTPKPGYWSDVEEALLNCNAAQDYTILLGDFNINWKESSTPRRILADSLDTFGLEPIPYGPTCHESTPPSTIDYICVSDISHVVEHSQLYRPDISKHEILFATFSFAVSPPVPRTIRYRSFRNFSLENFHRDLSNIDWHEVERLASENLRNLYDVHAPYRTFTPRRKHAPWMNAHIKALIKARNTAWTKCKRTGRTRDRDIYKRLRNQVQTSIRGAISSYFNDKLLAAENPNELWRCVGELGLGSSARDSFTLPSDVDALNQHFAGALSTAPIRDTRPTVRISSDAQFYFSHVTSEEVIEAVLCSRSNVKSCDDLPMRFIKDCFPTIVPVLLNIFDASLQSDTFPSMWKSAIVRPLPKRRPPRDAGDLRISILYATSKALESVA